MTRVKTFSAGALLGVVTGAIVFGAIFHFVLIGGLIVGAAGGGLYGRRRALAAQRARQALKS